MRKTLIILAVMAMGLGSQALADKVRPAGVTPPTFDYDRSKCSGESFQTYDYDYRYAYSHIVCAKPASPNQGEIFLVRRDIRNNRSELLPLAHPEMDFPDDDLQILGIDRQNNLYWRNDGLRTRTGPISELAIQRTNLATMVTDTVRLPLKRPALEVGNRGYYNGGYLIQTVDAARKRTLYSLGPDGDIVEVFDDTTAGFAHEHALSVPNTYYSPLVVYTYTYPPDGAAYTLKGIDIIDGRARSTLLNEAQISPYQIRLDGTQVDISLSQAGDRFVMSQGAIGQKAYDKWSELILRDFEDSSLDTVVVYDAQRKKTPFFTVAQPHRGTTAISPDGQLFYRQRPMSVSVRRIRDGKLIWEGASQTSHVRFLDSRTLLLNDSSHSTIIPLKE